MVNLRKKYHQEWHKKNYIPSEYKRGEHPNCHKKRSEESKRKTSETLKKRHQEKKWGFRKGMKTWNKGMKGFQTGIPRHDYDDNFKKKISKSIRERLKKEGDELISRICERVVKFRDEVRARDNFKCVECGKIQKKRKLHVHHINYNNDHSFKTCITLCSVCHAKTNWNREKWQEYFKEKLSKLYNYKYLQEVKNGRIYVKV